MTSKTVRQKVLAFDAGKVFRVEDLVVSRAEQRAAVVALGRLVREGAIERLSPGTYYKPKQTKFGTIGPTLEERFRDLLYENDVPKGYLTGFYAFNLLGLTTQQPTTLEIGTNVPGRSRRRGTYDIRFVLQKNTITQENIELLRLLDCLKWIKRIPDTSIDKAYSLLKGKVNEQSMKRKKLLVELAMRYSPLTRTLLGSMLNEEPLATELHNTLSPLTRFRIGLSSKTIPSQWNIE